MSGRIIQNLYFVVRYNFIGIVRVCIQNKGFILDVRLNPQCDETAHVERYLKPRACIHKLDDFGLL